MSKIKVTSPTRDQQLPVGKDLTVSGTSIDNATSNDCKVSVIVNKVRPYQPATATGAGGAADYSKWKFDITSKYTTIKPGENRITSKYECASNPDANSFSSVNVTGISSTATAASPSSSNRSSPSLTSQPSSGTSSPATNSSAATTATAASPSSTANQTTSSPSPSPSPSSPTSTSSAVNANQTTSSKQQQTANDTRGASNSTANPLANIPVIGKLFGAK
jgi:hypothetical protein